MFFDDRQFTIANIVLDDFRSRLDNHATVLLGRGDLFIIGVSHDKIIGGKPQLSKTARAGFARFGIDNLQNLVEPDGSCI